jgi:hypothetical protein
MWNKRQYLKMKKMKENAEAKKWNDLANLKNKEKKMKVKEMKKSILQYRRVQAHRLMHGPPGKKQRKNKLAGANKSKRRPTSAASTGILIDMQKREKLKKIQEERLSEKNQQKKRPHTSIGAKRIKPHTLNADEIHHLYRLSVSPLIMPPERPVEHYAVKPSNAPKGLPTFVKKLEKCPNISRKIKKHVASMSHLLGSDSDEEEEGEDGKKKPTSSLRQAKVSVVHFLLPVCSSFFVRCLKWKKLNCYFFFFHCYC